MVNLRSMKDRRSQEPVSPQVVSPPPPVGTKHGSPDTLLNILLTSQQQQMTSLQQQITLVQQQLAAQKTELQQQQQQQPQSKSSRYFLELKEAHAPTFAGSTDPLEAVKWITEMEKFCQALCIPKDEWVNVTIPFLIADAEAWFISIRPAYESSGRSIDWVQFRDVFFLNYFPATFRIEKENKFFDLKQGSLTVIQYASMFNQLGRFALMVSEQSKVIRFKEGLNLNLREYMETPHATTCQGVLEQALRAERLIMEKNKIRDSKRPRPCNEQYEETDSASNKKATQEDLAGSTVHGQDDKVVRFRSLKKPKEDEFCLELSKLSNYDEVVESVARHFSLDDPSKIRLTAHNYFTQKPHPQPIKYRGVEHLIDMLIQRNKTSDILYYEVLDIPLPELQGLKTLKVSFHNAKDEVVSHTIRMAKRSTVGDVMIHLKTKVELSHPNAELRLLKIHDHKISEICPLDEMIEKIDDEYWILRAEEIPEEEKYLGPHDRVCHVYHFMKDIRRIVNFGNPFWLVVYKGETLAEVKSRIQQMLQVSDEEFSKWKFSFSRSGQYLQDSDIILSCEPERRNYCVKEYCIRLEHSDNTPKGSSASKPM